MKIIVNGREIIIDEGGRPTVAFLLEYLNIMFKVVVEKNGNILDQGQFGTDEIREGDVFEIVQFVGGG